MSFALPRSLAAVRWRVRRLAALPSFWGVALGAALILATIVSAGAGAVHVPAKEVVRATFDPTHPRHAVLARVRLPRIVAAIEVGAALAVAGALMQTAVRNPLADAGLLGVSAGAGLAAVLLLALAPAAALWLPLAAFGGALAAVLVLLGLAALAGARATSLSLLLAGVALQAILFAGIAVVSFLYADRAPAFIQFTVGSLAASGWRETVWAAPALAVGILGSLLWIRPLDLLLYDDASATSLGLSVASARWIAALLAAILAGSAVALGGLVGFVGLLVPNWMRLAVGSAHARLLPLCALAGATLTVVADLVARTAVAPLELPVGAILALVGGPYFLLLLFRRIPT
jgi:iron complex transport system permease protein